MGLIDTTIVIHVNENVFSLEKTLHAYNNQTYRHFNIIIINSDLLSSDELEYLQNSIKNFFFDITILNKQNHHLASDYIINTTVNLLPGPHFIEEQVKKRELGYYISGVSKIVKKVAVNSNIEDIYEEKFLQIASSNFNNESYFSFWTKEIPSSDNIFKLNLQTISKLPLKQKKIKNKLLCAEVTI